MAAVRVIRFLRRLLDVDDSAIAAGKILQVGADGVTHEYADAAAGGGVSDHGALTGLADNDHPQYETTAEVAAQVATHSADTTSVHGIADTTVLATDAELQVMLDQAVILAPASSARNVIQPTAGAVIAAIVKAHATQSVDLTQWQDSAGVVLAAIAKIGTLSIGTTAVVPTGLVFPEERTLTLWNQSYNRLTIGAEVDGIGFAGGLVDFIRSTAGTVSVQQQKQRFGFGVEFNDDTDEASFRGGVFAENGASEYTFALSCDVSQHVAIGDYDPDTAARLAVYGLAGADVQRWLTPSRVLLASITETGALDMVEQVDPAAPAANVGRLFVRDDGAGKTQLCVRFPTGAVHVLGTQDGGALYAVGGTDVALADGGTGASLADPNADQIMFWDDSAGAVTWLTPGTNLTITGTTLDASTESAMVLISDTVLGADAANFDVTGISGSYKHLKIIIQARGTTAAQSITPRLRLNNDSGSNYKNMFHYHSSTTATLSVFEDDSDPSIRIGLCTGNSAAAGSATEMTITITNYAGTTFWKSAVYQGASANAQANVDYQFEGAGTWHSTAAIDRITIFPETGSWLAGSRLTIYGMTGTAVPEDASGVSFTPTGSIAATDVQAAIEEVATEAGGGGAPTDASYVTVNAEAGLSAETLYTALKLDDFAAPDDNTDLNASTTKHGLLPKLSNVATEYLSGTGVYSVPPGAGAWGFDYYRRGEPL